MIQHIRVRRVAAPAEILEQLLHSAADQADSFSSARQADVSLDLLVRHALRTVDGESDGEHVWQKLARKMRGPSGAPALEGPTVSSLELELMATGGWSRPVPFAIRDKSAHSGNGSGGAESLWSLLRFDHFGLPQRGCSSLLA